MGEDSACESWNEHADDEAESSHAHGEFGRLPEHFLNTRILSCSIVVSRYRLHPLVQTHAYHHEHEYQTVAYTVGSDSEVSAVFAQLLVDEQGHKTGGSIHQERSHAYCKRVLCHSHVQTDDPFLKMERPVLVIEVVQHYEHGDCLCYYCRPGCSGNAHVEDKDEDRVQYCIEDHGEYRQTHRLFRTSGRAHRCIQTEVQMGDDVSDKYDGDVFLGIGESVLARSEEI